MLAAVWAGIGQTSPVDVTGGNTGTTANVSDSITTTINGDLCVDAICHESNTIGTGYNQNTYAGFPTTDE